MNVIGWTWHTCAVMNNGQPVYPHIYHLGNGPGSGTLNNNAAEFVPQPPGSLFSQGTHDYNYTGGSNMYVYVTTN